VRGEITVVVGGAVVENVHVDPAGLADEVADLVASGDDRKAAIRQVATRHGLPKREVYQATL
jgi:16S rRNA (cytidine1402-2'-O)-methyltransferase